jgi:RHS repeat-associated protein
MLDHTGSGIAIYWIHNDHLGRPLALTDEAGDVVWRLTNADAFGNAASIDEDPDNDTTDLTFNLRFPGQYYDAETGLHYNYFRDYDPRTGRYVESDPVGLESGLNVYAYVSDNPLKYIDQHGLTQWSGTATSMSFVIEIGAAFQIYELVSECFLNERYRVKVYAVGPAIGFGSQYAATNSGVVFTDNNISPDPRVFDGIFYGESAGWAVGAGPGASATRLGSAISLPDIGVLSGIDASIMAALGTSTVVESVRESCGCE